MKTYALHLGKITAIEVIDFKVSKRYTPFEVQGFSLKLANGVIKPVTKEWYLKYSENGTLNLDTGYYIEIPSIWENSKYIAIWVPRPEFGGIFTEIPENVSGFLKSVCYNL